MASNITDLNQFKKKSEDKAAGQDLVNAFMQASQIPFDNSVLSSTIKNNHNIMFFAGEELRLSEGTTRTADSEQILHAAESQLYDVEVVEQLKVLKLRFPDGELYVVSLDQSISNDDVKNIALKLDDESKLNQLISRENMKSFIAPEMDKLSWDDKQDYRTEGLELVLTTCDKLSVGLFLDGKPQFANIKESEIIELAKNHTMSQKFDFNLKKITISFSDDDSTFIALDIKDSLSPELMKQCSDVLSSEVDLNRSYRQNSDPNILRNKAIFSSTPIEVDDELRDYMDDVLNRNSPEVKNDDEDRDNIVSLRPR